MLYFYGLKQELSYQHDNIKIIKFDVDETGIGSSVADPDTHFWVPRIRICIKKRRKKEKRSVPTAPDDA